MVELVLFGTLIFASWLFIAGMCITVAVMIWRLINGR
jgi:hypothetical protein